MGDNKHISQKVKSLYDVLKSNGEDVGSEQEFNDWFLKPGQEGYKTESIYGTRLISTAQTLAQITKSLPAGSD